MNKKIIFFLLFLVFTTKPLFAVPVLDWKTTTSWATNMMEWIADAYIVTKGWRDSSLGLAKTLGDQADQMVQIRRDFEAKAYGELAGLGKNIPDWKEYANYCEVSVGGGGDGEEGTSICEIDEAATNFIENTVRGTFHKFNSKVFAQMDSLDHEISRVVQSNAGDIIAMARSVRDSTENVAKYHILQHYANTGLRLERIAEDITAEVDSLVVQEDLENAVSSGRATQIHASVSIMQAKLELEITRSAVIETQAQVFEAKDRLEVIKMKQHVTNLNPSL